MQSPETTSDAAPDTAPDDPDRAWARRLHELTGEVELIISGGMLVALTQVPSHLDAWWDSIALSLSGPYFTTVFVVWYYAKLMVFTLVGAFAVHIIARAYWVGLLGLDSVFPDGIRWERIRYGPIAKRTYQEAFRTLPAMARRADHFGSTIFSFAFWIVLLFVLSSTVAALAGLGALGLRRWVFPGAALGTVWWVLLLAIVAVPLLAVGIDRLLGARLDGAGRPARLLRAVLRANYLLFAGPLLMPIQFTLFSNLRRRAMWGVLGGVFVVLIGLFVGGEKVRSGDLVVSASEAFPTRPGSATADGRYYESASNIAASRGLPTIQSDVVEGPYVRLRLPFVARRDAARMRERCPTLPTLSRRGPIGTSLADPPPGPGEEEALIGCLAGLWTVRLDGNPVRPDWVLDAGTGASIDGLVAYLSTEALTSGAHLLEVFEAPPPPGSGAADDGDEPRLHRHFIRFWI